MQRAFQPSTSDSYRSRFRPSPIRSKASGNRIPGGNETTLENEQGRKAVQGSGVVEGDLNKAFFEILLDVEEGPYVVREAGLFDVDGDLIAVAHYDPPVNKPKDTVSALLRVHVLFSDLQNLVLQVQGTDAYVPVERKFSAGDGLTGGGDMSVDRTLAVAFADAQEAVAGGEAKKVISPVTLKAVRQEIIKATYPIGRRITSYHDLAEVPAEVIVLPLDRSEVLRATYPELWALAQTSGRYDATGASEAAYGPGDGNTTFQLFDTRAMVERGLDQGRGIDVGRTLGSEQGDAIRNITGWVGPNTGSPGQDSLFGLNTPGSSGAFGTVEKQSKTITGETPTGPNTTRLDFNASRVVPTASENRVAGIAVNRFIVAKYNFGA